MLLNYRERVNMLEISETKKNFIKDSKPWFYLADTCWSAFTNISEEDWEYYLDTRRKQGFNVIQVNMLWQWDSSTTNLNYLPFHVNENGEFDFSQPNQEYFDRAERMVATARDKGIVIALVLLWCNYLPNTWASDLKIRQVGLFPKEEVEAYTRMVVERFDQYNPIYIISGDTDFQTEEVINEYYSLCLNTVKLLSPNALTTLHIRGREKDLPKQLEENPNLDFYMYQSGHNQLYPSMCYELGEYFANKEPKKPVLNSEPCYEMMGFSRNAYGRFSREDVRKVAWQSVLSGAQAGITYGAHGIWSWHDERMEFDSSIGESFETPYDWHQALTFKGASDYGYLKSFMEKHHFEQLVPNQTIIQNGLKENSSVFQQGSNFIPNCYQAVKEIRAAETETEWIIYVPSNIKLQLKGDLSSKDMLYISLDDHKQEIVSAIYIEQFNKTVVNMHHFMKDAVLIIKK